MLCKQMLLSSPIANREPLDRFSRLYVEVISVNFTNSHYNEKCLLSSSDIWRGSGLNECLSDCLSAKQTWATREGLGVGLSSTERCPLLHSSEAVPSLHLPVVPCRILWYLNSASLPSVLQSSTEKQLENTDVTLWELHHRGFEYLQTVDCNQVKYCY